MCPLQSPNRLKVATTIFSLMHSFRMLSLLYCLSSTSICFSFQSLDRFLDCATFWSIKHQWLVSMDFPLQFHWCSVLNSFRESLLYQPYISTIFLLSFEKLHPTFRQDEYWSIANENNHNLVLFWLSMWTIHSYLLILCKVTVIYSL